MMNQSETPRNGGVTPAVRAAGARAGAPLPPSASPVQPLEDGERAAADVLDDGAGLTVRELAANRAPFQTNNDGELDDDALGVFLRAVVGALASELDRGRLEVEARGCVVRALAELRDCSVLQELGPAELDRGYVSLPVGAIPVPICTGYELTPRGRLVLRIARGELGIAGRILAELERADDAGAELAY